jgi:hypothetical protein
MRPCGPLFPFGVVCYSSFLCNEVPSFVPKIKIKIKIKNTVKPSIERLLGQ